MKKFLFAAIAFVSLTARADIIYEWVGNNDVAPFGIGMRLTFTDTAFDDGVVDLVMSGDTGRPQPARPDSELLSLYYTTPGRSGRIEYSPAARPLGADHRLRIHFTADALGSLSGSLYANNTMLDVGMSGSDGLWRVDTAKSDLPMYEAGCGYYGDCFGATGRFVRAGSVAMPEHADLPEPGSLALAAVGLLGFIGARRRQFR